MLSFNRPASRLPIILSSFVVTAYLFIPPLFDPKYKDTSYPLLAFPFALFVFSSLLLGSHFVIRILKINSFKRYTLSNLINKVAELKLHFLSDRNLLSILVAVSIGFFLLYLSVGLAMLENSQASQELRLDLFGADVKDWINLQYAHDGYKPAHTNILLIVQPLEWLLSFLPFPPPVSAVVLNSFLGSANIFIASILFWQLTQKYLYTCLLTLFLGFTNSYIVFGSIPESYMLGSGSLIATYILFLSCLKNKKMNLELWVLAGIFSFGVTITNFFQTLICFVFASFYIQKKTSTKEYLLMILEYGGAVISCSIFLSLIQNKLYGSDYFFMPNMVVYEVKGFITRINLFTDPLLVIKELFKHFFLVNFIAAQPSIINSYIYKDVQQLSFFGIPLSYSYPGLVAVVLWSYLFIVGTYRNVSSCLARVDRDKLIFLSAVSLAILYNMVLHSLYGTVEMFIYTCYFTFLVAILFIDYHTLRRPLFTILLGILISIMAINNLEILLSFRGYSFIS